MRFHLPFDDVQWKAARKLYSDMREYVYGLRKDYPPNSQETRQLLRRLRQIVQYFARELIKARDRIDTRRLNSLSAAMIRVSVDYIVARQGAQP